MFKQTLSNGHFPNVIILYFSVFPKFTPQLFFLYLLPPIILEAAYCLHNEHFFDNIRSILFFAVVGTVINFLLTGGLLIFVKVQRERLICVEGRPTFLILFRPLALLTLETLCPLWKSWYSPVSSGKIRNNLCILTRSIRAEIPHQHINFVQSPLSFVIWCKVI